MAPESDTTVGSLNHASKQRLLQTMSPGEPYATSELADKLGEHRRTVNNWLNDLADRGFVTKKKVNARTVMWFRDVE